MGVRNYVIGGVSGAGKTAVATELARRGHHAVHGDRELAYRGDPETGRPVTPPTDPPTALWLSQHHILDLAKVEACLDDRTRPLTFLCGAARNLVKFAHRLDAVFVLDVDAPTMNRRIAERVARDPTDFGASAEERALITRLFATKEDLPPGAIHIDATGPLARVVDTILARCGPP